MSAKTLTILGMRVLALPDAPPHLIAIIGPHNAVGFDQRTGRVVEVSRRSPTEG